MGINAGMLRNTLLPANVIYNQFDDFLKVIIGFFPNERYVYPSLRSSHIYMKDAHCTEPDEKSIFRCLFFELWLFCEQFSSVSP